MRTPFSGYYSPTEQEFESLWANATFVFDTNVLLNLYRLPVTARNDLLKIMRLLSERVWLPHQVALEFQRKRLSVIASERKVTEDELGYATNLMDDIKQRFDKLQLDKRDLGVKSEELLKELHGAHQQLIEALKAAHQQQLDISSTDPIRDELDELFLDRVGTGPASQSDIDLLVKDGDDRYAAKIPPGYMDQDKDKNPNEAFFVFDGIKFQRKFGDLILWRQLIQHAEINQIDDVILVTADKKEDWWWREQGRTIGPHPELVREIRLKANVKRFWMYSSDQFVSHATTFLKAEISGDSVTEIKNVSMSKMSLGILQSPAGKRVEQARELSPRLLSSTEPDRLDYRGIEESVGRWLQEEFRSVIVNQKSFPDFLVEKADGFHGYEVKVIRHFDRFLFSPIVINAMLRGYMETNEGRLRAFSLVVAIPDESYFEIVSSDALENIRFRLARLLGKYPITEIIVGAHIEDGFSILLRQTDRFIEE